MAAKRGRKPRTPAIDIHALTGLTHTELVILELDLKALRTTALKGLGTHYYIPADTFERLRQLVKKLRRPWTPEEIKRWRWYVVRNLLDSPYWYRGYVEACELASASCQNTPAAAGPRMMSCDYRAIEKALPKGERCARTYRKRSRLTPAERKCRDACGPAEQRAALRMSIQEVAGDDPERFEKTLIGYLKAVGHLEVETLRDLTGPAFGAAVEAIDARRRHNARSVKVHDVEQKKLAALQRQERNYHLLDLPISAGK